MEDPTKVVPAEQEDWEGADVPAELEDVVRTCGGPVEPAPILLNVELTTNWVSVPIADGVELQNGPAAEGSTT
ncbi:hypothetical protein V6N13_001751 [Hibiscus sabdariffa]|uniref:Uncharacterized protein n=1 Tax=Hibiscus sabdariffa TaxID=183260 RepID=A0ABR2GA60_9ROSI